MAIKKSDKKSREESKKGLGYNVGGAASFSYADHLLNSRFQKKMRKIPTKKSELAIGMGALLAGVGASVMAASHNSKALKLAESKKQKKENAGREAVGTVLGLAALLGGGSYAFNKLTRGAMKVRDGIRAGKAAYGARAAKKAATQAATTGKAVKGSVLKKGGGKVRFVKVRGRIVPIRSEIK